MTGLRRSMWVVGTPVRAILIGGIHLYQSHAVRLDGRSMPLLPFLFAVRGRSDPIHGAAKGSMLAAWRLLRCNPYGPWGFDHVPPSSRRPVAGPDPDATSHATSGMTPCMTPSHDSTLDDSTSVNA